MVNKQMLARSTKIFFHVNTLHETASELAIDSIEAKVPRSFASTTVAHIIQMLEFYLIKEIILGESKLIV